MFAMGVWKISPRNVSLKTGEAKWAPKWAPLKHRCMPLISAQFTCKCIVIMIMSDTVPMCLRFAIHTFVDSFLPTFASEKCSQQYRPGGTFTFVIFTREVSQMLHRLQLASTRCSTHAGHQSTCCWLFLLLFQFSFAWVACDEAGLPHVGYFVSVFVRTLWN